MTTNQQKTQYKFKDFTKKLDSKGNMQNKSENISINENDNVQDKEESKNRNFRTRNSNYTNISKEKEFLHKRNNFTKSEKSIEKDHKVKEPKQEKKTMSVFDLKKNQVNIIPKEEIIKDENQIGRMLPNGQLRTIGQFYCPKDMQLFELKFDFQNEKNEPLESYQIGHSNHTSIYIEKNCLILYDQHETFSISEMFLTPEGEFAFLNMKSLIFSDNKVGFKNKSYFGSSKPFIWIDHTQIVIVRGPYNPIYVQTYYKNNEQVSDGEYMLKEHRSRIIVNEKEDMSDETNKFKNPFTLIFEQSNGSHEGFLEIYEKVVGLCETKNDIIISSVYCCFSSQTLLRLNSRFDKDFN